MVLVERLGIRSAILVMRRSGVRLPKAALFTQVTGLIAPALVTLDWAVASLGGTAIFG